jgi:hypothetical protein
VPYEVRYAGPFHRVLEAARSGEVDLLASLKDSEISSTACAGKDSCNRSSTSMWAPDEIAAVHAAIKIVAITHR